MFNISGKALTAIIGVTAASTVAVCAVAKPTNFVQNAYAAAPSGAASETSAVSSETVSSEESSAVSEIVSSAVLESSAAISSSAASSQTVSSKTAEQQTNESVSKIKKTTDDGVSKIQAETSKAIAEVKKVAEETTSTTNTSAITHKVTCETTKIAFQSTGDRVEQCDIGCEDSVSKVDETNKCVIISFGGHFPRTYYNTEKLKEDGFKLKNAAGTEIDYEPYKKFEFKVQYTNLSDVSEMYFCYEDQKIKITVS